MTKDEASKRYNIPLEILDQYESWGLCSTVKKVMGQWQYDDSDLAKLSLIMTLHDIGFAKQEIELYMNLSLQDECDSKNHDKMLAMLEEKRHKLLDEIHFKEKYLSRLDYLRYEIKKEKNKI